MTPKLFLFVKVKQSCCLVQEEETIIRKSIVLALLQTVRWGPIIFGFGR